MDDQGLSYYSKILWINNTLQLYRANHKTSNKWINSNGNITYNYSLLGALINLFDKKKSLSSDNEKIFYVLIEK